MELKTEFYSVGLIGRAKGRITVHNLRKNKISSYEVESS